MIYFSNKNDKYLGVIEVSFANYIIHAFLTKQEENQYIAFVPTSLNPTYGYVIILKKTKEVKDKINNIGEVKKTDIKPSDGMSKIISLGFK